MLLIIYLVIGILLSAYYYGNIAIVYKNVFGISMLKAMSLLNVRDIIRDTLLWVVCVKGVMFWNQYFEEYEAELRNQ